MENIRKLIYDFSNELILNDLSISFKKDKIFDWLVIKLDDNLKNYFENNNLNYYIVDDKVLIGDISNHIELIKRNFKNEIFFIFKKNNPIKKGIK